MHRPINTNVDSFVSHEPERESAQGREREQARVRERSKYTVERGREREAGHPLSNLVNMSPW